MLIHGMKVVGNSVSINKGIKAVKNLFRSAPKEAPVLNTDGQNILAEQAKAVLKLSENYVEPAQTKFPSTKSMLRYSSARCVDTLKKENVEHTVIFNLKTNNVLAEFKGDSCKCPLGDIDALLVDKENIGLMHGHPIDFPLSFADVAFMRNYGINQIIAVNPRGEFSFVGRKQSTAKKSNIGLVDWYRARVNKNREEQAFINYSATSSEDAIFFRFDTSQQGWKEAIHDTLETYIPPMNMRYVTNYSNLKTKK